MKIKKITPWKVFLSSAVVSFFTTYLTLKKKEEGVSEQHPAHPMSNHEEPNTESMFI